MTNDLDKCDFNTKSFSLDGMSLKAKIVNVLDGDTVALVIPIFGDYYKFNSRMKGIDTCEIHSMDKDVKNKGLEAKCRLIELLTKQKIKDLDRKSVISFSIDLLSKNLDQLIIVTNSNNYSDISTLNPNAVTVINDVDTRTRSIGAALDYIYKYME